MLLPLWVTSKSKARSELKVQLSDLKKEIDDALLKYGDREVLLDVDGRKYDYCYAPIKDAGMAMCDEDYEKDPQLLGDFSGGPGELFNPPEPPWY